MTLDYRCVSPLPGTLGNGLETFLATTNGEVALETGAKTPGKLLNILQHTGQPHTAKDSLACRVNVEKPNCTAMVLPHGHVWNSPRELKRHTKAPAHCVRSWAFVGLPSIQVSLMKA